jgi:hypothetical protein
MIDRNATLSHHVFKMPQAQRIGHVPAHARQNHVERIMQPFEHSGHHRIQRFHRVSVVRVVPHIIADRLTATKPPGIAHSTASLLHVASRPQPGPKKVVLSR